MSFEFGVQRLEANTPNTELHYSELNGGDDYESANKKPTPWLVSLG